MPDAVVLYINRTDSVCGACNKSCLPYEKAHVTPCGWDQHEGCGAVFTHLSSHYTGFEDVVRACRPDLPWVDDLAIPAALPENGGGE